MNEQRLSDGALQALRDSVQYERKSIAELGGAVTLALAELIERRAAEAAARAGADFPDEIGNVDHTAWKRWRVEAGYPDHVYHGAGLYSLSESNSLTWICTLCGSPYDQHHEDMIDWAELPDQKRQKYIVQGMAGYESGRAAAQAEGAGLRKEARTVVDLWNDEHFSQLLFSRAVRDLSDVLEGLANDSARGEAS